MAESLHDEPKPPTDAPATPVIRTDGGAVVQGNVDTRGGEFIGRDKVIYIGSIKLPRWLVYSALLLLATVVTAQVVNLVRLGSVEQTLNQPTITPLPTVAPTPTPTPTPQRMNGVFNLAVAQFGEQNAAGEVVHSQLGRELSLWLARRLNGELQSETVTASLGDVLVWHDDLNRPPLNPHMGLIQSEAAAAHLVQTISATMIISGVLVGPPEQPELRLAFYYASPVLRDAPDAAQGQHLLGTPVLIEFAQDPALMREAQESNPELVHRATLLVWLIKALARETIRKPLQALELFQQAESRLENWDNHGARSVFYYFMGRTALLVQNLPEARRTLEQAVAENPENGAAQIGLGNYYYTLAQLYFVRQQPLVESVARCATAFSNAGVDVNISAATAGEVPADSLGAEQALSQARNRYELARDLAQQQRLFELADVADLMLASAHRLAGEGYLFQFDRQRAAGEAPSELLDEAQTHLAEAEQFYQRTLERFSQSRRFGFLAYAHNGLGLTQRAQGYLKRQQAEVEQAKQAYGAALDQFRACSALRNQPDRNGDVELQQKTDCFCTAWGAEVEQQYINLGGGEG